MNPLVYPVDIISPPRLFNKSTTFPFPQSSKRFNLQFQPKPSLRFDYRQCRIRASSAAISEIDMVRTKEGVFAPKQKKVVVLWDLDNKPPRGPPYAAAMALKKVAQQFGDVVEISAYANRHAFIHLPQWVLEERRERRNLDYLERKGIVTPSELYICSVCGRKCKTNLDLKKHFKQLHERERQKKLNRMHQLKGKKRQKYKERHISENHKYNEAARTLLKPKTGYGLASELKRAGVFVKTVEDKPQAADWALKRQMQHSMSRGIDWMFLVSDDSDFSDMLRKAGEANLGTVVVGDSDRALGRHADLWVPWIGVENGDVSEKDLVPRRKRSEFEEDGFFTLTHLDEGIDDDDDNDDESSFDSVVNEIAAMRSEIRGVKLSAFSEEHGEREWEVEELSDDDEDEDEDDLYWDSEDDEI